MTPEELVEIECIKRVKYAYARCLDLKGWDELAGLFTEDAVATYSGGGYTFEGRDAILDFLQRSMGAETFHSSHKMHHPEIDLTGPTTAVGTWALDDVVVETQWGITIRGCSFYNDEYVKVAGNWKIKRTGYRRVFEEIQPRGNVEGLRLTASWWATDGRSELPRGIIARMPNDLLLDRVLVERFRRDGFVVIDGLLSEAELDFYEPLVTNAVATRKRDAPPLEERTAYAQSFHQCINLWEDYPAIRPLTFHAVLGQAAAELLGVDGVRLWHDQALYKEAGGRATDPHQDHPYWPIVETASVTAWIPFCGSTHASGAMGYLPGSHTAGVRTFVNIFTAEDPAVLMDQPEIHAIEPVYVEVPKGSVAFHHGLTVHMAQANTTAEDRAVHTIIYIADGATRRNNNWHFSVDRDGIEVGAPINGAVTPIVWPRPAGDLPAPPPPLPEVIRNIAGAGTLPEPSS